MDGKRYIRQKINKRKLHYCQKKFQTSSIIRDNKGYFIIIQVSIHDLTILNVMQIKEIEKI